MRPVLIFFQSRLFQPSFPPLFIHLQRPSTFSVLWYDLFKKTTAEPLTTQAWLRGSHFLTNFSPHLVSPNFRAFYPDSFPLFSAQRSSLKAHFICVTFYSFSSSSNEQSRIPERRTVNISSDYAPEHLPWLNLHSSVFFFFLLRN